MTLLLLGVRLVTSLIFAGAVAGKVSGKTAAEWDRWGFARWMMYATAVSEVVGVVLLWTPRYRLAGAALLALILLGAIATLLRNRECPAHVALPLVTLVGIGATVALTI
jgi:hypothetical protein